MTGLPFVYAFWAGRPGIVGAGGYRRVQQARDEADGHRDNWPGVVSRTAPTKAALADLYLRENVKYALGEREVAGLRRFYELAAEIGILGRPRRPVLLSGCRLPKPWHSPLGLSLDGHSAHHRARSRTADA